MMADYFEAVLLFRVLNGCSASTLHLGLLSLQTATPTFVYYFYKTIRETKYADELPKDHHADKLGS